MIIDEIAFIVMPIASFRNKSGLPIKSDYVQFMKKSLPLFAPGDTYIFEVPPFSFSEKADPISHVAIKVVFRSYDESKGYTVFCSAGPFDYPGLCLAYGETKT